MSPNIRPPSNINSSLLNYDASQQKRNPNISNTNNLIKSQNKFDDQRPFENLNDDNNENLFEDEFVNQNQNLEPNTANRNLSRNRPLQSSYNNFVMKEKLKKCLNIKNLFH